ncbi:MAG: prohibitin family protein, partial [Deinococcales bacterium]
MGFISLIALALVVLGLVLIVQSFQRQSPTTRGFGVLGLIAGLAIMFLSQAFVVIPAGHVGVVFNVFSGVQQKELGEGLKLVLPVVQQVSLYDAREQSFTFATDTDANDSFIEALSQEGLQIEVDATIRYKIIPSEAADIYQNLGMDYVSRLVRPQVRSVIRNAVANYKAAEVISTRRTELEQEVSAALVTSLNKGNIELVEVLLRDIRIPASVRQV